MNGDNWYEHTCFTFRTWKDNFHPGSTRYNFAIFMVTSNLIE
jgi:hypothetical protein